MHLCLSTIQSITDRDPLVGTNSPELADDYNLLDACRITTFHHHPGCSPRTWYTSHTRAPHYGDPGTPQAKRSHTPEPNTPIEFSFSSQSHLNIRPSTTYSLYFHEVERSMKIPQPLTIESSSDSGQDAATSIFFSTLRSFHQHPPRYY